jgi:hypothetical protein
MLRILLLTLAPATLLAEAIIPPANLFRDPKFVRDFVGSYGFLSDVEPVVSAAEQEELTKIRELFEQSKFREAERELAAFIEAADRSQGCGRQDQPRDGVCDGQPLLPGRPLERGAAGVS